MKAMVRPLAITLAAACLLLPSSGAAAGEVTCRGQTPTIVSGDSAVTGTDGDDVIVTTGQSVDALGGDDLVCALGVFGGDLSHTIDLGPGDDLLDDTGVLVAGPFDVLLGSGADTLVGGPIGEFVKADDESAVDADIDHIDAAGGPDGVSYSVGERSSSDVVELGPGDDLLVIGQRELTETVDLGDGANWVSVVRSPGASSAPWRVDAATGAFAIGGETTARWTGGVEQFLVRPPSASRLAFLGSAEPDALTIMGVAWLRMNIRLGAGDDKIVAPPAIGGSLLEGGVGTDLVVVDRRTVVKTDPDRLVVDLGHQQARAVEGARDEVSRVAGFENATLGTATRLVLRGSSEANELQWNVARSAVVSGGRGADQLAHFTETPSVMHGGRGDDVLSGNVARAVDRMFGGRGNDSLRGGPGRDSADGGSGLDRCVAEAIRRCETP